MIKNHVIGVVGLARGNVAFYDPITKIHLTLAQPQACVWNYMNTIGLKKAVRGKAIVIVSGYLYENHIIPNVTHDTTPIKNPKDSGAFDSTATPVSDEQYTSIDISDNVVMPEEVQETVQEPLEETAVEAENAVEEENVTEEKVDDQSEAQPEEEEKKPARKSRKKKSTEE